LLLQEFVLSPKIRISIDQLRLDLLDAGGCLFDLRLQRPWVDFREQIAELDLLTHLQADRFELP
jgi:hypothetical protein